MTERTRNLIANFAKTPSFEEVPNIIIALQEEDNVSDVVCMPNYFKRMRNMCAHEPANFVACHKSAHNKDCNTLVFTSNTSEVFCVKLYQFTAWMFMMYKITKQAEYILFWLVFCKLTVNAKSCMKNRISLDVSISRDFRDWYRTFEAKLLQRGVKNIRNNNYMDVNLNKIYGEDPKHYLRIVLPDLMSIVYLMLADDIDAFCNKNIYDYLKLYLAYEK